MTGHRPFAGQDRGAQPWELLDELRTPPLIAELPDDLRGIAARALASAAEDRFAAIDELRAAIAVAQRTRSSAGPEELAAPRT